MNDYNRSNRSGGGRHGGGDFRRRDSGRREMHKAVCDNCGRDCEVPFRPRGDKPIFCSDCFEKKDRGGPRRPSRRSSEGSGFGKRDNTNKLLLEQLSSLNAKLDKILTVIESSAGKKPASKKPKVKKAVKKAAPKDEKTESKKTTKKEDEKPTLVI